RTDFQHARLGSHELAQGTLVYGITLQIVDHWKMPAWDTPPHRPLGGYSYARVMRRQGPRTPGEICVDLVVVALALAQHVRKACQLVWEVGQSLQLDNQLANIWWKLFYPVHRCQGSLREPSKARSDERLRQRSG